MLDHVRKSASGSNPRLIKARSTPNVSKTTLSTVNKQNQSNGTLGSSTPNKSSHSIRTTATSKTSIKASSHDIANPTRRISTNTESSSKNRLCPSSKPRQLLNETRSSTNNIPKNVSSVVRNDRKQQQQQQQQPKSANSSSCTILEDRVLLKKGLTYSPDKLPVKPEASRRRTILDRSASLGCVSVSNQKVATTPTITPRKMLVPSQKKLSVREKERKVESLRSISPSIPINKSISLWNVHTSSKVDYNQCRKSPVASSRLSLVSKPSKIPLPAARITSLGHSLADLSQIDRIEESHGQINHFKMDLEIVSNEHIYENCRDTLNDTSESNISGEIYTSTPTSNLEKRAAQLMAQLDDDEINKETIASMNVVEVALPRRTNTVYEDRETLNTNNDKNCIIVQRCSDQNDQLFQTDVDSKEKKRIITDVPNSDNVKLENEVKKKKFSIEDYRQELSMKNCDKSENISERLRKNKESPSIQELRRNWERHAKGTMNQDTNLKTIPTVNSVKTSPSKTIQARSNTCDDTKKKQYIGKRTKDIEHLVNFFNCKNAEASERSSCETSGIKSTSVDIPIVDTPVKRNKSKNGSEYNGYASDGNCSEDSGHMSNENEVEWKENVDNRNQTGINNGFKEQTYFNEIDRSDDVKIFNSTVVCRHSANTEMKKVIVNGGSSSLMSSGASSIDSCQDDKCLKSTEAQVR